ncbi:hypothetical protein [Archangium sp.]|uniref:hypothetical protein n=1 Tax=Archangium sp. TaxID=1872627 RepID=UPI00286A7DDF|nr:hypothetical protein [Archangium sp.]
MNARWLVVAVALGTTTTLATPLTGASPTRIQPLLIAQVANAPRLLTATVLQMPDTLRTRMLASLAQGDVTGAISIWELEMGRQAPQWILLFQSAFSRENQRAGPCIEVARNIAAGFRHLGGKPTLIRFTSRGSDYLAFEVRAGDPRSTVQLSDRSLHVVVQFRDKIYDAFTGPEGLTMEEYLKRLVTEEGAQITSAVVNSLDAP